ALRQQDPLSHPLAAEGRAGGPFRGNAFSKERLPRPAPLDATDKADPEAPQRSMRLRGADPPGLKTRQSPEETAQIRRGMVDMRRSDGFRASPSGLPAHLMGHRQSAGIILKHRRLAGGERIKAENPPKSFA